MNFSVFLRKFSMCVPSASFRKSQHQWLISYPTNEVHVFYICTLLCHVIEVKPEFRRKSSQRYLKGWEQVFFFSESMSFWKTNNYARNYGTAFLWLWELAFLERSSLRLKMIFATSLPHKFRIFDAHSMVDITQALSSWPRKSYSLFWYLLSVPLETHTSILLIFILSRTKYVQFYLLDRIEVIHWNSLCKLVSIVTLRMHVLYWS